MTATASKELAPEGTSSPGRLRLGLRRDWLFVALLVVAVAVRVLATVTYRPGLALYADSYDYVRNAAHLHQDAFHPLGYAVFLRALWWMRYTVAVVAVQHLLGLAAGVATYLSVRRLVTRPWLAAVAAAPVLLDGYQIYTEQFLLSDTLFLVLVLAACLTVLVPERPGRTAFVAAGLLLAAATLTRGLGLVVLLPVAAYLVVRKAGYRRTAALGACAVLPVAAYMLRFHQTRGQYALEQVDGLWLYGRTAYFASCRPLPPSVRPLCPSVPAAQRQTPETYTWSRSRSPLYRRYPLSSALRDRKGKAFAVAVIKAEPVGFLRTTLVDGLFRDISPVRTNSKAAWPVQVWQMPRTLAALATNTMFTPSRLADSQQAVRPFPRRVPVAGASALLHGYQTVVYAWGPVLVLGVVLPAFAVSRRRSRSDRRVWVAVALAAGGVLLLVIPALTVVQDYRYVLPAQALLWPAGALAVEALLSSRAGTAAPSGESQPALSSGQLSRDQLS